jgi:hypothetical protein
MCESLACRGLDYRYDTTAGLPKTEMCVYTCGLGKSEESGDEVSGFQLP